MGRKKEITLYQLVNTRNRYARRVKTARGWAQAKPLEGEPGSYYLRLHKNGKATFESVGKDLATMIASYGLMVLADAQQFQLIKSHSGLETPGCTIRIVSFIVSPRSGPC
jgi:hypothetical protein